MNWSSACCHSPTIAAPPINFLAMAITSIDDLRSLYRIQLERSKSVIAMMKPDDERDSVPPTLARRLPADRTIGRGKSTIGCAALVR
jgi:hypothetical protein